MLKIGLIILVIVFYYLAGLTLSKSKMLRAVEKQEAQEKPTDQRLNVDCILNFRHSKSRRNKNILLI